MSFNRPHPSTKFQAFVFKFIDDLPTAERFSADVYWQEESALIVLPSRVIDIEDDEVPMVSVKDFAPEAKWGTL